MANLEAPPIMLARTDKAMPLIHADADTICLSSILKDELGTDNNNNNNYYKLRRSTLFFYEIRLGRSFRRLFNLLTSRGTQTVDS